MLFDAYASSKMGPGISGAINGSAGAIVSVDLLAYGLQLVPGTLNGVPATYQPVGKPPFLWVVRVTVETRFAHTSRDATVVDTVGTGMGFFLMPGIYWPVLVESPADAMLFFIASGATAGTLYANIVNYPGPDYRTF